MINILYKRGFFLFLSIFLCFISAKADWSVTTGPSTQFSSARAVDLNQDGIKDIVTGGGIESLFDASDNIIFSPSDYAIVAIDGDTGAYLWTVSASDQIFGSPVFQDVTSDGIPDVFIGGRNGYLMGIDGSTGDEIWQFYTDAGTNDASLVGLYNFYTAQFTMDFSGDTIPELLVANGGDRKLNALDPNRPSGTLMIVNPVNGSMIASADMPDGLETYMSPVTRDFHWDRKPDVIFGTGGETIGGSLWRVPVADILKGDLSAAIELYNSPNKGFIAAPSIADINGDNVDDIIANAYDGTVIAIDGLSNTVIWEYNIPGTEINASPTMGLFNSDATPDIFITANLGVAPNYSGTKQVVLNGDNGSIISEFQEGFLQFSTGLAYDTDSDGIDEIINMVNQSNAGTYSHDLILFDINDGTQSTIASGNGSNLASTPWIGNMNNDGLLDMFFSYNTDMTDFNPTSGITHECISLSIPDSNSIAYGSYLGTHMDGFYDNPNDLCFETIWLPSTLTLTTSCPGASDGFADIESNGCFCMFNECEWVWDNGDTTHYLQNVPAGEYWATLIHEDFCEMLVRVTIEDPTAASYIATSPDCAGEDDGSIEIFNDDPAIDYVSSNWSDGGTGLVRNGLSAGTYTVELIQAGGCIENIEVLVTDPAPMQNDIIVATDCLGSEVVFNVTGGAEPFLYTPDGLNFFTDNFLLDVAEGMYNITVLDANGCTADFSYSVGPTAEGPTVNLNGIVNDDLCDGLTGNVTIQVSSGENPYTDNQGNTSPTGIFIYPNPDAGDLDLIFTDFDGCTAELTVTIPEEIILSSSVEAFNASSSDANDGLAVSTISSGNGPFNYDWGTASSENTSSIMGLGPGDYSLTITDANGCEEVHTFTIENLGTSIEELSFYTVVKPNPTSGAIIIEAEQVLDRVIIFRSNGQEMNSYDMNSHEMKLDLSSYPDGIYILHFISGERNSWTKVIVE